MTEEKALVNEGVDDNKKSRNNEKKRLIHNYFEENGKTVCIIATCIVFLFILLLVSRVELISDDWHFKFIFTSYMPGEGEKKIGGLGDIVTSMKNFYVTSGGRVFAHSVLQTVLMADKSVFNILNSLIFVLAGALIWKIAKRKDEKPSAFYLLTFVAMFIFLPSFGDSCIWVSGAVNYLWMSLIYLGFFFFVKQENSIGMCISAFLSGFTNEPVGGMIVVFMVTAWIVQRRRPKKSEVISCILVLIGMLFILLAPGNKIRAEVVSQTEVFSIKTAIVCMGKTVRWIFSDFIYIPLLVSVMIMVIFRKNIGEFSREISFLAAAIAGMGALTLSGTFLERAQFPCVIFLMVSFIGCVSKAYSMYRALGEDNRLRKFFEREIVGFTCKVLKIVISGLIVASMVMNLVIFFKISSKETKQMDVIREAAQSGETPQVTLMKYANTGKYFPREVSISNVYEVLWQEEYYGIDIEWEGD